MHTGVDRTAAEISAGPQMTTPTPSARPLHHESNSIASS